jgi:hypothetical protein
VLEAEPVFWEPTWVPGPPLDAALLLVDWAIASDDAPINSAPAIARVLSFMVSLSLLEHDNNAERRRQFPSVVIQKYFAAGMAAMPEDIVVGR